MKIATQWKDSLPKIVTNSQSRKMHSRLYLTFPICFCFILTKLNELRQMKQVLFLSSCAIQSNQKLHMSGNTNQTNLMVLLTDVQCQIIMSGVTFRVAAKVYYFRPQKNFFSYIYLYYIYFYSYIFL